MRRTKTQKAKGKKTARGRRAPNRVKELRDQLAWTKAELCRKAELAPQTLERIEEGLPTREDRRRAVAKALGKSYEDVFPQEKAA